LSRHTAKPRNYAGRSRCARRSAGYSRRAVPLDVRLRSLRQRRLWTRKQPTRPRGAPTARRRATFRIGRPSRSSRKASIRCSVSPSAGSSRSKSAARLAVGWTTCLDSRSSATISPQSSSRGSLSGPERCRLAGLPSSTSPLDHPPSGPERRRPHDLAASGEAAAEFRESTSIHRRAAHGATSKPRPRAIEVFPLPPALETRSPRPRRLTWPCAAEDDSSKILGTQHRQAVLIECNDHDVSTLEPGE